MLIYPYDLTERTLPPIRRFVLPSGPRGMGAIDLWLTRNVSDSEVCQLSLQLSSPHVWKSSHSISNKALAALWEAECTFRSVVKPNP
jgi:hypothetical protein